MLLLFAFFPIKCYVLFVFKFVRESFYNFIVQGVSNSFFNMILVHLWHKYICNVHLCISKLIIVNLNYIITKPIFAILHINGNVLIVATAFSKWIFKIFNSKCSLGWPFKCLTSYFVDRQTRRNWSRKLHLIIKLHHRSFFRSTNRPFLLIEIFSLVALGLEMASPWSQ